MKEQINNLLNKGLKYLELYMKNGREIILYKPNQESSNYTIELEEIYAVLKITSWLIHPLSNLIFKPVFMPGPTVNNSV